MRYVIVWEGEGSQVMVSEDDAPRIDSAVSQWLDTGRDSVLHLTTVADLEYSTLASNITSWIVSTPEGRQKNVEVEAVLEAERKQMRVDAGLGWEDE